MKGMWNCEFCLLMTAGNVGGWRPVRLWSDVPASSDQVGSSDEESCRISGAVHGQRTRTAAEAEWRHGLGNWLHMLN